jgi:hypothetical protein
MFPRFAALLLALSICLPAFSAESWNTRLVYGSGISGEVLPCG